MVSACFNPLKKQMINLRKINTNKSPKFPIFCQTSGVFRVSTSWNRRKNINQKTSKHISASYYYISNKAPLHSKGVVKGLRDKFLSLINF